MSTFYSRSDAEHATAFHNLKTVDDVAALLELPLGKLQYLAYTRKQKPYTTFRVPKKAGGVREITAPMATLKEVHKRILRVLQTVYRPRNVVHGFRKQRSCVTNAHEH